MTNIEVVEFIREQLSALADEVYAQKMKDYMKGHFTFYGVQSGPRKVIQKAVQKYLVSAEVERVTDVAATLWEENHRECQYIAQDLLTWRQRKLSEKDIVILEGLITRKSWWDSIDMLASNSVGYLLRQNKQLQYEKVDEWLDSGNIWLCRTAIIHQLKYKGDTDRDLLFAVVESQKGSKEFFINKACGWALRQYSKHDPASVRSFLDMHPDLHPLVQREAKKYLRE